MGDLKTPKFTYEIIWSLTCTLHFISAYASHYEILCTKTKEQLRSYCPSTYIVHLGLTGKNCETDVNECLQNPFPCFKGNCVNKWSTYECNCLSGYFGANCDNFLVQVIFCKNNTRSFNYSQNEADYSSIISMFRWKIVLTGVQIPATEGQTDLNPRLYKRISHSIWS